MVSSSVLLQHAVGPRGLLQKFEHAARVRQLFVRLVARRAAQHHRIAHDLACLPAGIDVVADVGDAVGREVLAADAQDRVLNRRRHPAVDAVADDVVELAERSVDLRQVDRAQLDVARGPPPARPAALPHLHRRQVDAHRMRLRMARREGNQVAAGGASQFEHAGPRGLGRIQAEQEGDGLQVLGRGLGEGM